MQKKLVEPMEFFKVDKISDEVFSMSFNVSLRFNVSLSRTSSNGVRTHYHKEYEYPSKTNDVPSLVTIKRNFDFYLSIETLQKDANGNKTFIRIGPNEYMLFKKGLEEALSWFNSSKHKNLWAKNKGEIILMPPIPEFTVSNLPMGKYLTFTPTIIDRGIAKADKEPGIRIYLGSDDEIVDMTIERFMGMYYLISCFNMYQSAIELINYLGRPEFGANRYVMETVGNHTYDPNKNKPKTGSDGINDRFVTPKNTKNNISLLEG